MRTKTYFLLLLPLLVMITSACENEIPFNLKDNPPKLIMNALINADSLNNKLFLHLTNPIRIKEVKGATVEVRVNGVRAQTAVFVPATNYTQTDYYRITTAFHPGDVVRIDAHTADGVHHAWAEVTVPQPIAIEKWDTTLVHLQTGRFTQAFLRYKITFSDRPKEKNFYRLIIDRRATCHEHVDGEEKEIITTLRNCTMISREDIVLTDGQPSMSDNDNSMFEKEDNIYGIFDDTRFTDSSYTMTVYTSKGYYDDYLNVRFTAADAYIRLLSISETEYYYLKALNVIDSDVYDETMMEPIKFASNVNGGIGIVSISTETNQRISLKR